MKIQFHLLGFAPYSDVNCFSSAPVGQCSSLLAFITLFLNIAKHTMYLYPSPCGFAFMRTYSKVY